MSLKCHQERHPYQQQRRLSLASVICIMMAMSKLAAAVPYSSLRRASRAHLPSSRGAFVAQRRSNARRMNTMPRSFSYMVNIHSGFDHIKSVQALSSVVDHTIYDVESQDVTMPIEDAIAAEKKHFHCYLLRSTDPQHPLKTYIGFTTNPHRRLRQHNGELASGARRTKQSGRPWDYVAVIDGFQDKVSAMQFEWAWQHVGRSKVFREAVGCDVLARKMKRRRGVKARLEELGILMNDCAPFNDLPLTIYFPEEEHHDLFCDVSKGADCVNAEVVRSLDEMPFAKRGPVAKKTQVTESISSSMLGNSIDLIQRSTSSLWTKVMFGRSNTLTGANAFNSLSRMSLRSKSSWALNAVAETDTQESQSENKEIVENKEDVTDGNDQVFKVPAKFKPYPFSYHKELTVRIESLTNLGFGIARVEIDEKIDTDQNGKGNEERNNEHENGETDGKRKWVVFVPNVIPGELVKVKIYRNYASYSDADLMEIIEPSPDRIEPKCELATICGGCQYQHITIDRQRNMKTIQVQELFERLGGFEAAQFPAVLDTLGTDEVFGYRSKITPHYEAPMRKKRRGKSQRHDEPAESKVCEMGPIGFKQKANRRLVDVPYCHIATPAINEVLAQVREDKREEARQGLLKKPTKGATLLLRDSDGVVETDNNVYVNTTVKDLVFKFKAGNFFQNNPFMLPEMVDLVVNAATEKSRSGEAMTHLIDCYCGSGLFALGSSSSFDVCVGIEVNEKAVEEARENAALNGIQNCDFVSASAEAIFQSKDPVKAINAKEVGDDDDDENKDLLVKDFPRETTVVVVDPPRKGCSEEFLEQLNAYGPARVVYMSCDPATQARDAKFLVSYGYEIVSIQPFDLFPQTRHIECLAVFEKKAKPVEKKNYYF